MEHINLVADPENVSTEEFEKGKEKQGMGRNLVLTWEERDLLDSVRITAHPHTHVADPAPPAAGFDKDSQDLCDPRGGARPLLPYMDV